MMLQGSSLTSRIGGLIDALTYMRRDPWRAQARMYDSSALRQHTACDVRIVITTSRVVVGLCHNPQLLILITNTFSARH